MAERYDFYVHDNRKITFNLTEPIMREDSGVTDFVFHIPKVLNELEVSDWQWWLVFVNAKKEKYSIALTLSDDPERPLEYNLATYTVDYAMSIKAGSVQFALEAINAGTGGAINNEWHTQSYEIKVKETLQGNQAEYAETESDVISALLIEVRNKVTQLVGGATPLPVNLKSLMTDPQKVYLYTGSEQGEYTGNWYYHNGTQFVSGGVYGAGVVDAVPTQGSTNAVQSGGVYEALEDKADKNSLISGYFTVPIKGTGYISRDDGSVNADIGYLHSDYFDVSGYNKLITKSLYDSAFNAFYDTNKTFISAFVVRTGTDLTIDIPADAVYMRVSSTKTRYADVNVFKTPSQSKIGALETAVEALEDDIEAISTATDSDVGKALKVKTVTGGKVTEWEFGEAGGGGGGDSSDLVNGYFTPESVDSGYISREDGSVVAGGSYVHSDYVDISGYSKLTTESAYTSDFNAFYDASKTFISAFSIAIGTDKTVAIPANAKYMRVSTTSAKYADSNIFKHLCRDNADKIVALQDAIDALSGDSDYFIPPIISTGYISNQDGTEQSSGSYSRSDYIDISPYKKLITNASYDGAFNAFYTSAKVFISAFVVRTGADKVIDVPTNAVYMRVSTTTAKYLDTYKFRPLQYVNSAKISDLDAEVDALADAIAHGGDTFAPPSVGTGNVSREDGSIVSGSYLHSDYIDISQFPKLLSVSAYAQDFNAFYKADKTFISSFSIAVGTDKIIEIPDGAMYMRVSASTSKYADSMKFRTLEYVTSDALPEYWFGHVADKCESIRAHMNAIGRNGDTFAFVTDIHWYSNQQMSPKLIRYLLNHLNINMVALGGDLIRQGTKAEEITESMKCVKALRFNDTFVPIAFGNHDNNSNQSDASQRFDANTVYSLFMKGFEDSVMWMTDTEFSFYFDKSANKTRYIFLDMGDDGVSKAFTAFAPFRDALLSTPSGYKIVIVAHIIDYGTFTTSLTQMIDAYNARTSVTVNSVVCDFTSASGSVVICLGGHRHYDDEIATAGGVPITVTDCDAMLSVSDITETAGTITEQAFDVVSLDYTNNLAYYERIGRNKSRIVHLTPISASTTLTTSLSGTVTWSSGDDSIATVSSGTITRVAAGTVIIRADNGTEAEIWVCNS